MGRVLKGSRPKIGSAPGRKSVPRSGYVVPATGELLVNKPAWFNYGTLIQSFRDFIDSYPVEDDKMIYMVIDNAPWHKKAYRLIQEEKLDKYSDIRNKIILVKLPHIHLT